MRSRASSVLPPSKLRERRRQARTWRFAALGALAALLLGGAISFFHISAFAVRDVRIAGAATVPASDIERAVREELDGSYLFVLPKRNAFLYSDARVAARLARDFPKLTDIDVSLENFHTIAVSVKERTPSALFCGESISEPPAPCLFMDADGIAYEAAPDFSDNAYVRFYGGDALVPGGRFLTREAYRPLSALAQAMADEGFSPAEIEVDAYGDVLLTDVSGASVRFTIRQKPEDVLKALTAARASDALSGKSLEEIEYIDLRFGKRLYYKVR